MEFNLELLNYILIALAGFFSGFIDSIVGGGGLIQFPSLMITFPNLEIPTVLGTNKISGFSGTSVAAIQYGRKVKFNWKILIYISILAFIFANLGAHCVQLFDKETLKPIILVILIFIAIYTFKNKNFGNETEEVLSVNKQWLYLTIMGISIGFYDGFFGPGTGSFLVLGFVALMKYDFLNASAYAKVVNCFANISALLVFIHNDHYILHIAIIMAIANVIGSLIGSRLAILKGNQFIRKFFLIIVVLLISRYSYDVFLNN